MKLEHQVCSLELANKLKELGVKQESYCYWRKWIQPTNVGISTQPKWHVSPFKGSPKHEYEHYSAFTVAELGQLLQWEKLYIFGFPQSLLWFVDGTNTEADARAKMLIHLIENSLMEIPK